jgi:hypothetical protein
VIVQGAKNFPDRKPEPEEEGRASPFVKPNHDETCYEHMGSVFEELICNACPTNDSENQGNQKKPRISGHGTLSG